MNNVYDFHLHTCVSDGALQPSALIKKCAEAGLKTVAITDHDTVDGIDEAVKTGETLGVKVIPGLELSTNYGDVEVHVLGYNVPYKDESFIKKLTELQNLRLERNAMIIKKLKAHGVKVDASGLYSDGVGVKGRYHIAKLLAVQKFVRTPAEAFDKYIGAGQPCFVGAMRIGTLDAIKLLSDFGIVSVLAHPYALYRNGVLDKLLSEAVPMGLDGIEVYYHTHGAAERNDIKTVALKYGLATLGGSDFHDSFHGGQPGAAYVVPDDKALALLRTEDYR